MMQDKLGFIKQTDADDRLLPADLPNWGYLLLKDLLRLKSQCLTIRKLTGSRSSWPAVLEPRHSATVTLETIGSGSRLVGKRAMEIYKDAWSLGF